MTSAETRPEGFVVRPTETDLDHAAPDVDAAAREMGPTTPDDPAGSEARTREPTLLASQIGGWRGIVESSLPTLTFIVINQLGPLRIALWAALVTGIGIFLYRSARRESPQQALGGLMALGVAVLIAAKTGESRGFFLPGILLSVFYGLLFAVSALARWPLIGVLWALYDGTGNGWRRDPRLMRAFTQATWLWVGLFAARGVVQSTLYAADSALWLGVSRLVMGLPLTAAAIAASIVLVQRARRSPAG